MGTISNYGASFHRGFVCDDCTKMSMQRPGIISTYHSLDYFAHKRIHCLIYQDIATPDCLMYVIYGPEESSPHN